MSCRRPDPTIQRPSTRQWYFPVALNYHRCMVMDIPSRFNHDSTRVCLSGIQGEASQMWENIAPIPVLRQGWMEPRVHKLRVLRTSGYSTYPNIVKNTSFTLGKSSSNTYRRWAREQIEMFKRKRIEDGVKVSEIAHQMTYDWWGRWKAGSGSDSCP